METVPAAPAREAVLSVSLRSLDTALPPLRVPQREALDFLLARSDVKESTRALYRRVFAHESVETRHFAVDALDEVFEADPDAVHARFERRAAELAAAALSGALRRAGVSPKELDFVATATCTGSLCPGLSSHLAERAGLRPDVATADLAGMGCGAAVPALQRAAEFARAHPGALAAAVCAEICSAAFFSDDDPGLVVSNALFADGAAAALVGSRVEPAGSPAGGAPRLRGFGSLVLPEWRETLRFRTDGGRLRNVLSPSVPERAAEACARLAADLLRDHGLARADVTHWIVHAGGEKVLAAVERAFALPPEKLEHSRRVLRRCGNMSSPTVLFALKELAETAPPRPGELGLMLSFGAGFSAYGALLEF